jgi:hypothetical protein
MKDDRHPTLYRTAEEFVEQKSRGASEVLGVLLTGSAASSYPDAAPDVDLKIIATENQSLQSGILAVSNTITTLISRGNGSL